MIIKGSNQPIVLEFDENVSQIEKLSCTLLRYNTTIKHWDIDDVDIDGTTIKLPLTEDDTLDFPATPLTLEIKWLIDGNIEFAEKMQIHVADRQDDTKLTGDEEDES